MECKICLRLKKNDKVVQLVAMERCKPTVSIWQEIVFIAQNNILMCRQFRLSSRSVICTKGIVMTVMIAWLLCNLSLLRYTGTTYLWDEIAIVNRFSFSFLWINCLLIRNLSRICDHMTADTCLRIATVFNPSQKYSRLHHYTCFLKSRICQRKFIHQSDYKMWLWLKWSDYTKKDRRKTKKQSNQET